LKIGVCIHEFTCQAIQGFEPPSSVLHRLPI
jgi:hypothetical protein